MRILQITDDLTLAASRAPILEKSGFQVATVQSWESLERSYVFDYVLICHSVEPGQAYRVAREIRQAAPGTVILRLTKENMEVDPNAFQYLLRQPIVPSALERWLRQVTNGRAGVQTFDS